MAEPDPAPAPPPPPAAPPRWHALRVAWHLLFPPLAMFVLVVAMAAALGGGAFWLLRSEAGTAWLLTHLPGVEARGLEGALISERFAAERLAVRWNRGRAGVAITGLRAEGLRWTWRPEPGIWIGLDAEKLSAGQVAVDTGPRSPRPLPLPSSLQPPLRLAVAEAAVDELRVDQWTPLRRLSARGAVGGAPVAQGAGREHRVERLAFEWDRVRGEASGRIGSSAPYPISARAALSSDHGPGELPEWTAQVGAGGVLARIELTGQLNGLARGGGSGEAPSLELQASVVPLEEWPLAKLSGRTQALDLAALSGAAPRTRLSGSVDFATRAIDAPVFADIQLDNALPGRWDEKRLPLRRIEARIATRVDRRDEVEMQRLDLHFSGAQGEAGRAQGSGWWRGDALKLTLQLEALRPQAIDARAAAMSLTGPLELTVLGLPHAQARAQPPARAGATGPLRVEAKGKLEGRLDAAPQPVELTFDLGADERRFELRELRAQAGPALATLTGKAERTAANAPWHVRTTGALTDFDPAPWWPGIERTAWRQGPHRLSAIWSLDLQVPMQPRSMEPLALAQSVIGTGNIRVSDSALAGVPLSARIDLGHRPGSPSAPSQVQGEIVLGGNRLTFDGTGDPAGSGSADRMRFEVAADNVATLAPLVRLSPEGADWAPRGGRIEATLSLEGRWPDVRSEGRASAQGLQAGELTIGQGRAEWGVEMATDQPLSVQLQASAVEFARQRIEQLRADLRGTLRQHRLDATAALPLQPPRALELAFGLPLRSGTLVRLQAEGLWQTEGTSSRWNGRVAQLAVGAWDGTAAANAVAGASWVDARDLRAELLFDPQIGFTLLQAAAGQMKVADNVTVRWDEVRVDLKGQTPAFDLRAEVEPFALAPLLARAQPGAGISGDLRLAARMELRAAEKLDAEVVFERRDGDLRITDNNGIVTAFGLEAVRATLSAHDGRWVARGAFSGRTIGEARATLNLRPRPEQRWPRAETPIDGEIEAQVANLGIWSPWVPPGWRLSGALRTSARVTGRIGEPDYSGEVRASEVAVRNLLQGVDLRGGEVRVALAGSTAKVERFEFKGGEGRLEVSGSAELGTSPSATLQLQATHFRLLGRVDRQLIVSGNAALAIGLDRLRLTGKFGIDEGLFDLSRRDAPSLDDDVNVRSGPQAEQPDKPPEPPRSRRQTQVAVDIDLGEKLRVRGRGIDTLLHGKLAIGAAAGKLTVHGIVDATGGTYAAYGQKLEISRGRLVFGGEADNPALDILALRPNVDIQVGVDISGSLLAPRVRLYSSPDLSDTEKLSWLVLGRATDGLGRTDTALLQRAAVALLAGEGEAPTDAVLRSLGIDELSLSQREGDVRETVISLGKQLSQRWYVGYERGVNATTGTFQLIYRIAQRFTLRAQSGNENSLDMIWTWRLQDPTPPARKATAAGPQ